MENRETRILIVEDRTIVREGLCLLISSNPDYKIVGEAEDGRKAIKAAAELKPDLILTDLTMPNMNGMEAIREIKRKFPEIKILVLTVHDSEEFILASLQAGADGYVLKEATQGELMVAIESVLDGKRFIAPGISDKVINGYLNKKQPLEQKTLFSSLTHREKEVLKLIAEGNRNKEIASMLCISAKTVDKHRENIMKKLDIHNAASLTAFAIEKGLIEKKSRSLYHP